MEALEPDDPRRLGSNVTLARIAVGGTATVYLGRTAGGRAVALKTPHRESAQDPDARSRFRRETELTRAVGGPYCPPVLDADPDAAVPWMATVYVPSVTLREAVETYGPLPTASTRRLAGGLLEALVGVHREGIAHLDLAPANVLLALDGPMLIDFGIAALRGAQVPAGSGGFMSPEQMAGHAGTPSDLYSLGATLRYAREGVTGAARTRQGRSGAEQFEELRADEQHNGAGRTGADRAGRNGEDVLDRLIAACTRPEPGDRPTAAELLRRPGLLRSSDLPDLPDRPAPSPARTADDRGTAPTPRPATPVEPPPGGTRRPTASVEVGQSPTVVHHHAVEGWLPASVLSAIDRRASSAINPPEPRAAPAPSRRRLLLAAGAAAVGAAAGAVLLARQFGAESGAPDRGQEAGPSPDASSPVSDERPSAPPSPPPAPSPEPVELRLTITGSGAIDSLTHWINGRATEVGKVALPWEHTSEISDAHGGGDWRLRMVLVSGKVRIRSYRNGAEVADQRYPSEQGIQFSPPFDIDTGGVVQGPVPVPDEEP
ncbi:serine/threonine protein kinase [Streptomyces sp. XM4193]|uniref:serine/threonine-protein kinase n=1 Tax=Streptomyces sp. XM4193 TaxID=2929782 RepID=UPI001FFA959A|nr:serine/threonine-protein kinase [Streptomyces sp. XM4193]MCK1794472.1 serine/threonine protein kinase [Streptomyces sp. XM4193]